MGLKSSEPHFPADYMAILFEHIESEGLDFYELSGLSRTEVEGLFQPDARISKSRFFRVFEAVNRKKHNSDFWLRYGAKVNIQAHGALAGAVLSCDNLLEAAKFISRYYLTRVSILEFSNSLTDLLAIKLKHFSDGLDGGAKAWLELLFVSNFQMYQVLTGKRLEDIRFKFDFAEPAYADTYTRYLTEHVEFGCEENGILIPEYYLKLKIPTRNPVMKSIYEKHCQDQMAELVLKDDLKERVKRVISATPGQYPNLNQVAEELFIGKRTLRRKLAELGTSFQVLLDEERCNAAIIALKNNNITVEEVAESIGFSDASNFRKAFLKWTGKRVSEVRV